MNAGEDVPEDEAGAAGAPSETLAEEEDELAMQDGPGGRIQRIS